MLISILATIIFSFGCKREKRAFQEQPPVVHTLDSRSVPDQRQALSAPVRDVKNDYEENAYALSEGKRLFSAYNCNGCHSMGGGGMGPPLMDDKWLYGGKPEDVFATIVAGRPNGMPSFRDRVPDFQVWQLTAYVRSMSGQVRKDAAPSRDDHLQGKPPESATEQEPIRHTPPPPSQ
ncbi:MAG TPA: c-type cytochrome [Pyrinomonadaceae bacterium]|nr:c-type cytochrome [Pyrinomonadaceae bacterium]